ncbi:MAG: hypothetical protein JWP87_3704 [Labilithrix sp.]|nr:hypothetical protein [Labilithrix sp.]
MAAAFSANRDIKIEASELPGGLYTLRTRGLDGKRRAELEVTGIPEVALSGAGGVINILADYSVKNAEVLAGQTVGNVLTIGEEGRMLLLAVRAVASEKAKGGLWSKLAGGGKGVLRLVDVTGDDAAPLTAVATMLVHRAAVRLAKDDEAGARTELEAAIAAFPGVPGSGAAPTIEGTDGTFNWQNHLAYLDLALLADDVGGAGRHYADALARSDELAHADLGATYEALAALGDEDLARAAKDIAGEHAPLVSRVLTGDPSARWRAAFVARNAGAESTSGSPGACLVSCVLADVRQRIAAGATEEAIVARYAQGTATSKATPQFQRS